MKVYHKNIEILTIDIRILQSYLSGAFMQDTMQNEFANLNKFKYCEI